MVLDQAKVEKLPRGRRDPHRRQSDDRGRDNGEVGRGDGGDRKGLRTDNLIALDAEGNVLLDEELRVLPAKTVVVLQNGSSHISYACNPDCMPTVHLGDDSKSFNDAGGEIATRNARRWRRGRRQIALLPRGAVAQPDLRGARLARRRLVPAARRIRAARRRGRCSARARPRGDPEAALTVFAAALIVAGFALMLSGAAASTSGARAPRRGPGVSRLCPRSGARRLSGLSRRARLQPAEDQRRLDRSRLSAAVARFREGAGGGGGPRAAAASEAIAPRNRPPTRTCSRSRSRWTSLRPIGWRSRSRPI